MLKVLMKINKNLIIAIPIMMAIGFVFGLSFQAAFLKQLILPFTFLMVYPMMITLNVQNLKKGVEPKLQATTQVINFLIIPFMALGIGKVFFSDQPYMLLGLFLAALLPTSGMTISWTGFAGGNMGAAINMTVIGLTLGSIATPFYIQSFLGASVEMDLSKVFQQILLIVALPMALGQMTRKVLLKKYGMAHFKEKLAPKIPSLSTLGVLGIVFIALALKAKGIAERPEMLGTILLPVLALYGLNFLLSTMVGRLFFQRGDGIALVYGTVMRNLSIALAVAINAFGAAGADAAVVIALSYIVQVQSAAWYVKVTDMVFGKLPETKLQAA